MLDILKPFSAKGLNQAILFTCRV